MDIPTLIFTVAWDIIKRVSKTVQEWWSRWRSGRPPIHQERRPQVPLIVVGENVLVRIPVPLTTDTRELLRIPRRKSVELIKPRLVAVGSGLVSIPNFLDYAIDENLLKLAKPTTCARCGKLRRAGAMLNTAWLCDRCYRIIMGKFAKGAIGTDELRFSIQLEPDNKFQKQLRKDESLNVLSKDPFLTELLRDLRVS